MSMSAKELDLAGQVQRHMDERWAMMRPECVLGACDIIGDTGGDTADITPAHEFLGAVAVAINKMSEAARKEQESQPVAAETEVAQEQN